MVFTLDDYIHEFWRFTVQWVFSNKKGHLIWFTRLIENGVKGDDKGKDYTL